MKITFRLLGALTVGSVLASSVEAQAHKCGVANDTSAALISELKNWMTTQNPKRITLRDNVFHIPLVSVSQVTLVTDERICGKVVQAYAALPAFPYTPSRVYVIKLGTKNYAGFDPSRKGGEFVAVHIFDSKYIRVGGWSS